MMSEREKQWLEFSERVATHLREYTVPQYGDVGEDLITNYTTKDCIEQVVKYAKRYGSQSRAGQQELDFVKIAHYVQCAWEKYDINEQDTVYSYDLLGYTDMLSLEVEAQEGLEYVNCCELDGKIHYFYRRTT